MVDLPAHEASQRQVAPLIRPIGPRSRWHIWLAAGALASIVLLSIFAPLVAPYDPLTQNLPKVLTAPDLFAAHPLGTDGLGRDILSRVLHGGRPGLLIALAAVTAALVIGVSLGVIAGYRGGWIDRGLVALSDIQLTIPGLILALLILVLFGNSIVNVITVIALESWPLHFRMTRAQTRGLKHLAYVEAAQLAGLSAPRVVFRHIVPALLPVLAVTTTMNFGGAVLAEASLSFLGLGVQPPTPDWGYMIAEGQGQLGWAWWSAVFPAAALLVLLLTLQSLGNHLSDRFSGRKG